VVEFFVDETGARFVPDWTKLESAGVRRDAVVDILDRDILLAELLRLVLLDVSRDDALRACVWDGAVVISTEASFSEERAKGGAR
jgi:hypothetical protein